MAKLNLSDHHEVLTLKNYDLELVNGESESICIFTGPKRKHNAQFHMTAYDMYRALRKCIRYMDDLEEAGYGKNEHNPAYIAAKSATEQAELFYDHRT